MLCTGFNSPQVDLFNDCGACDIGVIWFEEQGYLGKGSLKVVRIYLKILVTRLTLNIDGVMALTKIADMIITAS